MRRQISGLSLWLVFASLPACAATPAHASVPVMIVFAEQRVTLARDTSVYGAGRGAALQADDLMTTGAGTVMLNAGGATIAVGPASSVYVRNGELVLLRGWMKINGSAAGKLLVSTSGVQFDSTDIAVTVHATPGVTELFAESAPVTVLELPMGKTVHTAHTAHIAREQFGTRSGALPIKLAARPTAAFLAGMPRTFMDTLVPVAFKGPAVQPVRDRAGSLAELAPLLAEQPILLHQLQARLQAHSAPPRLARPAQTAPGSPNSLFQGSR